MQCFRLLTEYHSFLLEKLVERLWGMLQFPSPYGVSFILITRVSKRNMLLFRRFPSPYGVSFILMIFIKILQNLKPFISVSLRSIIHSYLRSSWVRIQKLSHFRLLTEYHSFLCDASDLLQYNHCNIISVSLRSYIHSYILGQAYLMKSEEEVFPSPYGVSFILIRQNV